MCDKVILKGSGNIEWQSYQLDEIKAKTRASNMIMEDKRNSESE